MKASHLLPGFLLATALGAWGGGASAQEPERPAIYPYDVKVGGHLAKVEPDAPIFARAPMAVKNDALVELGADPARVIVNVFPCDEAGTPGPTTKAQSGLIVANQTSKFQLNQMKNKPALEPGFYLMNIVVFGKGTSRVVFEIGDGAKAGPAPAPAPAGGKIDQSKPENVLQAVFDRAKAGDLADLKALQAADADGDVKRVCTVADAPADAQAEFKSYFASGKIAGPARVKGDRAEIDFLFGPGGSRQETMNLVRENRKWFLSSF